MIAAAHGTASAAGQATLRSLADALRAARPGLTVIGAFLDVAQPSLTEVVAALDGPAVVVPVLLSGGYHVRTDIPSVIAGRQQVRMTPPLGPDPALSAVLVDQLRAARTGVGDTTPPTATVLVAAGSSDPEAGRDLGRAADDLATSLGHPVHPAVLSGAGPGLLDVRRAHPLGRLDVASYLLAEGYFASRLARDAAALGLGPVSLPLGAHPGIVALILDRFDGGIGRPE